MKDRLKFADVLPARAIAEDIYFRGPGPEAIDLIVKLALWMDPKTIAKLDDRTICQEIDSYLGLGILCRPGIRLAANLARLCQKVEDGKKKSAVLAYLNHRIKYATARAPSIGRDLLADLAEDVKRDSKKYDRLMLLRQATRRIAMEQAAKFSPTPDRYR
jgi:hypothetical protein